MESLKVIFCFIIAGGIGIALGQLLTTAIATTVIDSILGMF